ncbi:PREDICTED: uncharacterized protein LOC109209790 [Nicotiana attenuata]|uniref:uncharacterized protein LOC109209790 n=1 Tax=Nicotiana attenuata TaxID=49451 RepID=UPI0009056FE1|nr:PREDICTED: uncharacterized protein LOC109209790 [Nicotiana attenuata]
MCRNSPAHHILPKIISANQSGFVKGGKIFENIMLGQEIVHGIKKPTVGSNVVIMLDMAKAYDRSKRGLKQGDPLAPSLFIIGVELLSRMLNILNHDQLLHGFYMEKRGPQIKSQFMTASYALPSAIRRIQEVTGFSRRDSPPTYLGCPLYTSRSRIMHFNGLISKVLGRIKGWHVSPPKTVMKQIKRLTASFFWGMDKDKHKYHRASWLIYSSLSMKVVWVSEPFMIPVKPWNKSSGGIS